MILKGENFEFRGGFTKKSDNGKENKFINVEDEFGNSAVFYTSSDCDILGLDKGDKISINFDYNPRYNSLKVSSIILEG